jgi:hypothetical protein
MQAKRILATLGLVVACVLLEPSFARANTITNFFLSGDYGTAPPNFPFEFSGLVTVDVTTGTPTAVDVSFPDLTPAIPNFNTIQTSIATGFFWLLEATNASGSWLVLNFDINSATGSLIGLTGGIITDGQLQHTGPPPSGSPYAFIDSGHLFIPSASLVPEPPSFPLLALGLFTALLSFGLHAEEY